MKKTLYSLMTLAAMAMTVTSCSDLDLLNATASKVTMTFSATQETSDASSRTIVGENNKVLWQSSDAIMVWDGTAKNAFIVTPDGEDATQADITGEVTAGSESFAAVYPNSVGENCTFNDDGTIIGIVIPTMQTATANSFDPASAIMTAETTNTTLAFKHICSFLKLTAAEPYKKIEFSVAEGYLTGTCTVVASTGVATLKTMTASKKVTLLPPSGSSVIAASDYYIAIAPGSVKDIIVRCYTSDYDYVEKAKSGTITFTRAASADLGETTATKGWKCVHEYVDLGLPTGTLWATSNVGATSLDGFGDYFAWGEVEPYYLEGMSKESHNQDFWKEGKSNGYNWLSYRYCVDSWTTQTKYNSDYNYGKDGFKDYKTILEPEDDAATVNWGPDWCMPSHEQFAELVDNCTWTWTQNYNNTGMAGYLVESKATGNTNSIFLPAAGFHNDKDYKFPNYDGYYWARTTGGNGAGSRLALSPNEHTAKANWDRCAGYSVRPVIAHSDQNLIAGRFSVSNTKVVKFTKGNLYWNGSKYMLEENQTDYPTTWDATHVGLFYWSQTPSISYAENYADPSRVENDVLWCDVNHKLEVGGTSGLYALSLDEWKYLLNVDNRDNKRKGLCKAGVRVDNGNTIYENCLIIAPDGYNSSEIPFSTTTKYTIEEINALGLICLPPTGYRNYKAPTTIVDYDKNFYYLTSSPDETAYGGYIFTEDKGVTMKFSLLRTNGAGIRLVKTAE